MTEVLKVALFFMIFAILLGCANSIGVSFGL
ncbi:hypothetical protein LMG8286_00381 [Campylobacter suis]|uniref:Uncharacterized protein n=1 Tax=Campylobacter suis TaxID=2790657 RepID=A0ABN7K1X0_9BACT|nr:hypothetical protein LMG8286_00381 [Campylobacter suis]